MATPMSLTLPPKKNGAQTCKCGSASCEGTCCRLDCLVQPRFFCGQLLTDQDLTALVNWTRDKTALSRYRDGWGVVCGLDVRCDPRGACDHIVVTPGYAVSCCGDDIVVCDEASLDLSPACRDDVDPCADLRRLAEQKFGSLAGAMGATKGEAFGATFINAEPHAVTKDLRDVHGIAAGAGVKVVDIYLRYDEKLSQPATAMGRGSCREAAECEYSRTRESYKLTWEYGMLEGDPVRARAEHWHQGYEKCLDVLTKFNARFRGAGFTGAETRRFLLDWLERNPQHYSCNRRDEICGLSDDDLGKNWVLTELLFQMVQDCRNAYLNCACFGCEDDTGVPLARVWFEKQERGGREHCCIVAIDPYPPFRRPLQPECWPAPLGYVNVGRAIWHRWEEVCTMMADLGVRVRQDEFKQAASPAELETALKCDLFVKCGEERVAYVIDAGPLGRRVVGFCTAVGTPPPPLLCPTITLDSPSSVPAGEHSSFDAAVRVTGGDMSVTPTYNWTVSAGTIESGQGTPHITVNTAALSANTSVSATVDVGGYDHSCPTTARRTTIIGTNTRAAIQVDEFDDAVRLTGNGDAEERFVDENARLDIFAIELQTNPRDKGYIIVYDFPGEHTKGGASERADRAKDYLVNARGIDPSRIEVMAPGFRSDTVSELLFELWRVPEGADPPRVRRGARPSAPARMDDFTDIPFIGEARAKMLRDANILTYKELAGASVEKLKEITGAGEELVKEWIEDARKRSV